MMTCLSSAFKSYVWGKIERLRGKVLWKDDRMSLLEFVPSQCGYAKSVSSYGNAACWTSDPENCSTSGPYAGYAYSLGHLEVSHSGNT